MKILIAIDGSECSYVTIEEVAKRPWFADSAVRIISVAETLPPKVLAQAKCSVEIARRRYVDDDEE
jgi:hypothetical protein